MRNQKFTAARRRLVPIAAILLATALGGCVAYSGYPSGYYGANYPYGYYGGNRTAYVYPSSYSGYSGTYTNSYNPRPYYSRDYNGSFNTYQTNGGGGN
jgi:hypothetical protein